MRQALTYLAVALLAQPALALQLGFSGPAEQTFADTEEFASYAMPIGPFKDDTIPTLVAEGAQERIAWKVPSGGTTLGVADSLRQQIEAVGFELLFECETLGCGGFDFRFGTPILPEPDMHVDLGDFRYLAAQRLGEEVPEYLSLLVSRSDTIAYVQMIKVGGGEATTTLALGPAPQASLPPLIQRLERDGSAVLQDVQFGTGSSELSGAEYETLITLAGYLISNPNRTIALVGHTDAEGALEGNIALSRERACSARAWLIARGVDAAQIEAEGVGYLAPVASNLTEEGRTKNRRVEAILTSTR
ncbi:MAG: OmpA family protein [Litoreibacter sp.]|nr:OmpA family protein [Litoreibacter sp.]